jgi:hypothetical protein
VSLLLYTDVHVPIAITRALRRKGHDVLTAQEDDAARLPDPELLDRALELGRVLFTRDQDFLEETALRMTGNAVFASVIYAHQFVPLGVCVSDLDALLSIGTAEDATGHLFHLPL